jgi:hypothetical protein
VEELLLYAMLCCRVSHAAKAFEGCDRSYKAVFAEPKKQKNPFDVYDRFSGPPSTVSLQSYDASYSPFSASMYCTIPIILGTEYQKKYQLHIFVYVLFTMHLNVYACNETNLMQYVSSVYSVTVPLHVSGLLVVCNQEVTMYICNKRYVLYILVDRHLAWLRWNFTITTYCCIVFYHSNNS